MLTNLIVSDLDVPPSALNQLSEPEYAKSLVTYNLFFAKRIEEMQDQYCSQMTDYIRSYLTYDPILQKALSIKLSEHSKKQVTEKASKEVVDLAKKDPNKYHNSVGSLLHDIINNFEVTLPSPNIVVDKVQFNELREFLGNLSEVADQYYPQDMIPSDDQAAQNGLQIMKAKFKKDSITNFINRTGLGGFLEAQDPDDTDTDEVVDFIQIMQNLNSKLTRHREEISNFPNNANASGGDGFGGDFGGGFDDMGMGGDAFGGGMDMGGDFGGGGGDAFGGDMGGEAPAFKQDKRQPKSDKKSTAATLYSKQKK
jgi:hypothetical protein